MGDLGGEKMRKSDYKRLAGGTEKDIQGPRLHLHIAEMVQVGKAVSEPGVEKEEQRH